MVGHEGVGVNDHTARLRQGGEVVDEQLAGSGICKDGGAASASVHHMVTSTWEVDSGTAGHVRRNTRCPQGQVVSRIRTVGLEIVGNETHMTPAAAPEYSRSDCANRCHAQVPASALPAADHFHRFPPQRFSIPILASMICEV